MKPKSQELETFNATMDAILRADPKAVKEEMRRDKQQNAEKRKQRKMEDDSAKVDPNSSR